MLTCLKGERVNGDLGTGWEFNKEMDNNINLIPIFGLKRYIEREIGHKC